MAAPTTKAGPGPAAPDAAAPEVRDLSIPGQTTTALAPARPAANPPLSMRDPYEGISRQAFPPEVQDILQGAVEALDVEVRPDGIVYLPEIKYRRVLNKAFGAGAWALHPRGEITMRDEVMYREYALLIKGRFISESIGEQRYIAKNEGMTFGDAAEGVKSNALMRCCKDLGIASELWDPGWRDGWMREWAVQVRRLEQRGRGQFAWRRKDRGAFYDEQPGSAAPWPGIHAQPAPSAPAAPAASAGTAPAPKAAGSAAPPQQPRPNVDTGMGQRVRARILLLSSKTGTTSKGPWTLYGIKVADELGGEYFINTFDDGQGTLARAAKTDGKEVIVDWSWEDYKGQQTRKLNSIEFYHEGQEGGGA